MLLLSLLFLAQAGDGAARPPHGKPPEIKPIDPETVPTVLELISPPRIVPAPPPPIYVVPVAPRQSGPVGASPRGNPARWITSDDYPDGAYFGEQEGTTGFRLDVAADGRASACTITASSGNAALDNTTCALVMRRARFNPAIQDGKPVPGTYANRVRWDLPPEIFFIIDTVFEGEAPFPAYLNEAAVAWQSSAVYPAAARKTRPSGRTIIVLDVDAEGKVAGCTIDVPSGNALLDKAACPLVTGKLLFDPGLDEEEKPAPDRARIKLRWEPPAAN